MANYLDKAQIPIAAQNKHKFPLHSGHITTGTFMRYDISMARELAPKSSLKINHQTFIRTIALKKPLLSSVQVHSTALFVPFRVVWEPFTDFISDTPHNQPSGTGIIANVPLIDNDDVWVVLSSIGFSIPVTTGVYDYTYNNTNYKFTSLGRWAYSLFVQLGYKWSPLLPKNYRRSCLPFLCAVKAYLDWYFPNGYAHYGAYAYIDGIMQRQVTYILTSQEIDQLLKAIYRVAYNPDYFVDAFDNPSGPNSNVGSINFNISDFTLTSNPSAAIYQANGRVENGVDVNNNGTPALIPSANNVGSGSSNNSNEWPITQYGLMTLHALSDYCRRHQLSGSRALERYLSAWGVALTADKLKRSIKLSESKFPFQVGEVMSSSDTIGVDTGTGGSQLGDYAGRAVAYDGNLNVEFDTDEFGYYIVVNTIIPDVGYVQGQSRFTGHKTKLDFLTGEFDGLGTQEIGQGELFIGLKRAFNPDNLFGFTGRYAEYKTISDTLSGDFLFDSVKQGLLGWETCRLYSDDSTDATFNITHSLSFMLGEDSIQYNRIFIDDESDVDGFILVHRHNLNLNQPSVPLYDIFDWSEENRKRIDMQVNGVKTN